MHPFFGQALHLKGKLATTLLMFSLMVYGLTTLWIIEKLYGVISIAYLVPAYDTVGVVDRKQPGPLCSSPTRPATAMDDAVIATSLAEKSLTACILEQIPRPSARFRSILT